MGNVKCFMKKRAGAAPEHGKKGGRALKGPFSLTKVLKKPLELKHVASGKICTVRTIFYTTAFVELPGDKRDFSLFFDCLLLAGVSSTSYAKRGLTIECQILVRSWGRD